MGSLRFRRSMKLAPGVRMSVSKTGLGLSAGVTGARYSVHSTGRRTRTVGVPGTGVSHVTTLTGSGASRSRSQSAPAPARSAIDVLPKPGWLSGKAEKRYHEGIHAYIAGDHARSLAAMQECLAADPSAVSPHLFAAISIGKLNNTREALAIARECRTLLGANGITLDYPLLRHANNLESVLTYEGTAEVHQLVLGQALTGESAFR